MSNIKIISITIIFLFIGLTIGRAQFMVKQNEFGNNILKETKIYYEIKELSNDQIEKINDQRTIDMLKEENLLENQTLAKILEKHWDSGEKITGLTTSEIEARINSNQETWYISVYKHVDKFFDKRVHKSTYHYYYQHYTLSLHKDKKSVLTIPLVNNFVSELDIHFAVNLMQEIANDIEKNGKISKYAKAINQNSALLKQKTLLIPKNYTNYSEEYLNQFYNGKVKIASEQEIIDAIHKNDAKYAYLLININHLGEKPSFNHFIVDCATEKPIFLYRQSNNYTKTGIQKTNNPTLNREIQFFLVSHFKIYNNHM